MVSKPGEKVYLWGDTHVHSNWSDGLHSIKDVVAYFLDYEEDFHIQTDHMRIYVPSGTPSSRCLNAENYAAYLKECKDSSSSKHIVIPGMELGWAFDGGGKKEGWPHIKIYDCSADQLPDPSFFADKSFPAILRELKSLGLLVCIAHADEKVPWDELEGNEFQGLEIRYDIENRQSPVERDFCSYWDRWLCEGKKIAIHGGSDCHQMDLWAASAIRTVVWVDKLEPRTILESLIKGKSYLSATWHPDIYRELGYEGINPEKSGGFTPWWLMADEDLSDEKRAPFSLLKVKEIIHKMLENDYGRVKKKDYPRLKFSANGVTAGEELRIDPHTEVETKIEIEMNVPIQSVNLVMNGELAKKWRKPFLQNRETTKALAHKLPVNTNTYIRLEVEGFEDKEKEYLISNPIYIKLN